MAVETPQAALTRTAAASSCEKDGPDCFEKLNERVRYKTAKILAECKEKGTEIPPEVLCVQRAMSPLWCGSPVYLSGRWTALVYLYAMLGACFIAYGASVCPAAVSLSCMVITFLVYDAYSGVLHITFDEPSNLAMPIVGQPCLEFQWHHHLPDDLVVKPFIQCCADLNLAISVNLVAVLSPIHFCAAGRIAGSPVVLLLLGFKMLAAYFGQFSHRSAHQSLSQRGPWVRTMQAWGAITSAQQHRVHHTPPHDKNFCLIGPCNELVGWLHRTIAAKHFLKLFFLWSFFDIYLISKAMGLVFGSMDHGPWTMDGTSAGSPLSSAGFPLANSTS